MDRVEKILIDWLPFWDRLFEFMAALAWPIAVYFAAKLFKNELKTLLVRVKKVGPTGAEFDTVNQDNIEGPKPGSALAKESLAPLSDPVAEEFEGANWEALEKIPTDQREAALVRALTFAQLANSFERAYAGIFGSQLRTLNLLNGRDVPQAEAEDLLADYQEQSGLLQGWSIDEFMKYLIVWEFVDHRAGNYQITQNGRNFLQYLLTNRRSQEKPN
ncbi:hypothetical protein [Aliiroseovarius sp. S253]|uniref:hypothetical protein n=1 Tax=Aliiroseovarius sp. S253 TaxID=3415133 RepID=UPI003C7A043B